MIDKCGVLGKIHPSKKITSGRKFQVYRNSFARGSGVIFLGGVVLLARPNKIGLDYFSHDVDASNDEKIEAMEALYGPSGYCFYFKMLERIYRSGGELAVADNETRQILAKKCLCSVEEWVKMLATALKVGLFDSKIYNTSFVLTSLGICERFFVVKKKREKMANWYQKRVSTAETHPETEQKPDIVKESKGKQRKEDKSKREPLKRFQPPTLSELSIYCLERGTGIDPEKFIAHYESNGWRVGSNPMKSWKAAIITWEKREKNGTDKKYSQQFKSAQEKREDRIRDAVRSFGSGRSDQGADYQDVSILP